MATQRAVSLPRGRPSRTDVHHHQDHHMQMDIPPQKKKQHQRKKSPKHNRKTPQQTQRPAADGVVSDDELVEEEEEGDNGEDSDEADSRTSRETSTQRKIREEEEIWAGIMVEIEEVRVVEGDAMDVDSESGPETELGEQENEEAEDGGDEADLEAAADDDDYGDLDVDDNMSVASVNSRQFEKEYERDIRQQIRQEGIDAIEWDQPVVEEDGIDWEDDTTYHYNAPEWEDDEHGFVIGLEVFRPASEEHLFAADADDADVSQNLDVLRSQPVFGSEWPMPSDSENEDDAQSEKTIGDVERRQSHASDTSGLTSLTDAGYETDVEDMPERMELTSPAADAFKTPQRNEAASADRRITAATPRRSGLTPSVIPPKVLERLALRCKKAIAHTAHMTHGPVLVIKTPKASDLKWVPVRSRNQSSPESPASPTMVNLDKALLEGNTRTGAHISDAINGQLFRTYHCGQLLGEPMQLGDVNFAEFARLPGMGNSFRNTQDFMLPPNMETADDYPIGDALQMFVDFSGYDEEATQQSSSDVPAASIEIDEDSSPHYVEPTASPLKRRGSEMPKSISPELKRKKMSSTAAVQD